MKKSIRAKILTASLSVCVTALLLSATAALSSSSFLMSLASRSNREIGYSASENSERLLIEQAQANATELAAAKAANIHLRLSEFITLIENIRDYTEYLYGQKDNLPSKPIPTVDEIIAGDGGKTSALQMTLSPGTEYEDVYDEIGFYSNVETVFRAAMENWNQIAGIYVTTDSGVNIGYDANAPDKAGKVFDGRSTHWYQSARNGLYISDAYQDVFGRGLMITVAVPMNIENSFAVAGMDILIDDINEDILQTVIGENGYAMLIGRNGSLISAPGLQTQGESALLRLGSGGRDILGHILEGNHNVENSNIDGRDVSVIYAPVGIAGWTMAIVIPIEDILAPAVQAKNIINTITGNTEMEMKRYTVSAVFSLIALFAVITVLAVLGIFKLSNRITGPIIKLCSDIKNLDGSRLDYVCRLRTGDEIEALGKTFEAMAVRLKQYIQNLAANMAYRERLSAELNVATQIQTGMLPDSFPERKSFEIYADMQAAKEVGGDFYDFFMPEENKLAVIIADVSGKGIPAALFMVIAKTLIHNYCRIGLEPAAVLEVVNNQLCENNKAELFVTAFLGILEVDTGRFVYANAGHNPPAVFRQGGWEWLDTSPGFVLAGMEQICFRQQETKLSAQDRLLLYTDGVTEAQNREECLYTEQRLLSLLDEMGGDYDARSIIMEINADVDRFSDGAPQTDDITMLALRIKEIP